MNFAPQFGAPPEGADLERISSSPNMRGDRFVNRGDVRMEMGFSNGMSAFYEMLTAKHTSPDRPLPTALHLPADTTSLPEHEFAVTWYGHSTVLLEMSGMRLLIDPVFSPAASPLPIFGKRFTLDRPLDMGSLGRIDAVLISHDHYDHLDYATIRALAGRVDRFYVPLGVGSHLRHWAVDAAKITEMDWWDSAEFNGLKFTATPAQHFSGRSLNDRNCTLWASWVIRSPHAAVYFSGDSGYGPHFREIGERFGPFDFTMMETGQYNEKWRPIHSMPEESVQGHLDLRGCVMMPIHWGSFTLAPHAWTEPAERVLAAAQKHGVSIATPVIGERFIPARRVPDSAWWKHAERAD